MENAQQIAQTIISHLGGNQFKTMTGAKNFSYGADKEGNTNLSFKFGGSKVANHCRITLQKNDTYTVEFFKTRGTSFAALKPITDIYCEMLRSCFEGMTGLRTSLTQSFAA